MNESTTVTTEAPTKRLMSRLRPSSYTRNQKIVALSVAVVLGGPFVYFSHPLRKAPADMIALSYGGGPFEGAQYQRTIQPGSGIKFNGWFDDWYQYPTTQRDYIISMDPERSDARKDNAIRTPDKDGVMAVVELKVAFKLNTNHIRSFHENLGLKKDAWTEEGWAAMLEQNFHGPVETAVANALKEFGTDQIRKGDIVEGKTTLQRIQEKVQTGLKDTITTLIGEEYFCGPGFVNGQTVCPDFEVIITSIGQASPAVSDSYDAIKSSANGITVAENEGKQLTERGKAQAATEREAEEAINNPNYLEWLRIQAQQACAQSAGNCTLIVNGGATPVEPTVAVGAGR